MILLYICISSYITLPISSKYLGPRGPKNRGFFRSKYLKPYISSYHNIIYYYYLQNVK